MSAVTCDRCSAEYSEGGDGYMGLCPECADKTDNTRIYDAIWDCLEERYGKGLAKMLEDDAYGDIDEMIWRFIDEIVDTCERAGLNENEVADAENSS